MEGEGKHEISEKEELEIISGIREVSQKVLETCEAGGEHPSQVVCAFFVRTYLLQSDQKYELSQLKSIPEKKLQDLVNKVAEKVLTQGDPSLETLKLQVRFESQYASRLSEIQQKEMMTRKRRNDLLDRVVNAGTNLKSNTQVAQLYRAIFKLLMEDTGIPEAVVERKVERELAAALESVFPQSSLVNFNALKAKGKREHIGQMMLVIHGIRLFNKELGKGGAGIEDLPRLVLEESKHLSSKLEEDAHKIDRKAEKYEKVLAFEYKSPGSISGSVERLQNEHANRKQLVLLLNQLLHESLQDIDSLWRLNQQFKRIVGQLKSLVGGKTAVPKETVYPHFIELSHCWKNMEQLRVHLKMRQSLHHEISTFSECFDSSILATDLAKASNFEAKNKRQASNDFEGLAKVVETKEAKMESEKKNLFLCKSKSPVRLVKESTLDFMSLPLELQGFCPYTLVVHGGHLTPGEPNIGIIVYKGMAFTFAGVEEMKAFCQEPDKILIRISRLVRAKPHLAHLLCVQDTIIAFAIPNFLLSEEGMLIGGSSGPSSRDVGTQTPTHFLPDRNIDPKYTWNEWELRRRALQMASLTKKTTSSAQTEKSHFRRENATQYTLPKPYADGSMPAQGTQTRKSQGTNVPRTKRYMAGLRGAAEAKFVQKKIVMDGTEIVDQT